MVFHTRSGTTPSRPSAFTMIEMLVVILIIGIIVNFVALTLGGNDPLEALELEARRFTSLTELAQEEALLRSVLIGISIDSNAYRFLLRGEESWELMQETVFRERELSDSIRLKLTTEQTADTLSGSTDDLPHVVLLPSGEITPFELEVSSELSKDFYRISAEETGELRLDHVDEE